MISTVNSETYWKSSVSTCQKLWIRILKRVAIFWLRNASHRMQLNVYWVLPVTSLLTCSLVHYQRGVREAPSLFSYLLIPIDLVGDTLTRLISYSSISGNRTRKPDFPRNGSSSAMRWAAGGNLARLEITNTSRSSAITCSATACLAISSSATTCSRYSCENRTRVHNSEFVRMQWRMELVRPSAIAYCGAAVTKDCEFANFVARTEF